MWLPCAVGELRLRGAEEAIDGRAGERRNKQLVHWLAQLVAGEL